MGNGVRTAETIQYNKSSYMFEVIGLGKALCRITDLQIILHLNYQWSVIKISAQCFAQTDLFGHTDYL